MSDHKNLSDTELDGLFVAARSDAPEAGADLLARVLGDADAVQSTMHVIQPSRQKRRMLPQLVALLGGWPAMAGLVSAAVTGVLIGVSNPADISDGLATLWGGSDAIYLSDLTGGFELDLEGS